MSSSTKGDGYLWAKATTGLRDLWSYWTKDSASFDWNEKGRLEHARIHTYESSCIKCHENLFPPELTKEGEDAHLYYRQTKKTPELHCINCHLNAGHYIEGYTHGSNVTFEAHQLLLKRSLRKLQQLLSLTIHGKIPYSSVSFNMMAIPGGRFRMEVLTMSHSEEKMKGPVREVELSPFFMVEVEVTWDEYLAFMHRHLLGRSTGYRRNTVYKHRRPMQYQERHHHTDNLIRWGMARDPLFLYSSCS